MPHSNSSPATLDQVRPAEVYKLSELAPLVRVSAVTLTREIKARKLAAVKIRGQWRVQGADFLAYLESSRVGLSQPVREAEKSPPPQQGGSFTRLNPDRLLDAWRRQDADAGQPGGRSARSSG
jgi:excisionase family DNA binding protein